MAPCATDVIDEMNLSIISNPTVDAGSNAMVCENASQQLYGSASHYSSILWTSSGDGSFDDPTSLYAIYTPGDEDILNSHAILTLTVDPLSACSETVADDLVMSIMGLPSAEAGEDAVICGDESLLLNGDVDTESSILWSTMGDGIFDDETSLETIYYPGSQDIINGEVEISLTAFPMGPCSDAAVDMLMLTVDPIINEVETPNGPDFVDTHYTPTSEYSTESEYATNYQWFVHPVTAGYLLNGDNITSITWNESYQGLAYIYVKAINECNSMVSDSLEVLVDNTVNIDDISNMDIDVQVIPNPNNGLFKLELSGLQESVNCQILNSSGSLVHTQKLEVFGSDKRSIDFDYSDLSQGVYYIKLIGEKQVHIEKMIINY